MPTKESDTKRQNNWLRKVSKFSLLHAINSVTRLFAGALHTRNISVNSVCPGWVKTDMGGSNAELSVEKGAETVVWLATEANHELTGKFFKNKKEIQW